MRTGILNAYPQALDAEPFTPEHTRPDVSMTEGEEAAIRAWLVDIGERSRKIIDEVLALCQRSAEARGYYTRRAKE